MWYRKAIDFEELSKSFPVQEENDKDEFEAQEIIRSHELPKGKYKAIDVRENPKFEPFTKEERKSGFEFYDTAVDFFESIRDYPKNIDLMLKTLNIIKPYVSSKRIQKAKKVLLDCQSDWFDLIFEYEEQVIEEAKPSYKGEYLRVKPEDKQKAIDIITKQTKIVSDILMNIHSIDAQDEWMRMMAKRGYKDIFIPDENMKDRYLELFNQTWSY